LVKDNKTALKLSLFELLSENCSKKDGGFPSVKAGVCWHTESLQVVLTLEVLVTFKVFCYLK